MLHHIHQLDANCVCLLLGAERVAYSGVFRAWKQPSAATEPKCGPENQNNAQKTLKGSKEMRGSLSSSRQASPLTLRVIIWAIYKNVFLKCINMSISAALISSSKWAIYEDSFHNYIGWYVLQLVPQVSILLFQISSKAFIIYYY